MLVTRHAQTLISRASAHTGSHTALSPDDASAALLVPELSISLGLLQGLCLLSDKALAACAEDWVIEVSGSVTPRARAGASGHVNMQPAI